MKKLLLTALIVLGVLAVVVGINGCTTWETIRFGMGAMMREDDADYAELERQRAALAEEARASADEDVAAEPYWTDFLGPGRRSVYDETRLVASWPEDGPPALWRVPIGFGYSSVVVADGLVFTLEQRQADEVHLVAFDRLTGAEVWTHGWKERFYEEMSKVGPRSTPVWHAGSVLALGAAGELRRVDAKSGELIWRRNVLDRADAENLLYGLAGSPLVVGDLVVVGLGKGGPGGGVLAVDFGTGAERWRSGPDYMAYTSPQLDVLLGRPMITIATAARLIGLDPESGAELWSAPWEVPNALACTQPVVAADDRVFMSSGYGMGAALFELSETDDGIAVTQLWRSSRFKARFDTPILLDGHVIGLDEGVLACVRVADGERRWKSGRYGQGQTILADGRVIVLSEDGELALVDVDFDDAEELASFQALPDSMTMNPPALAHGLLYVRNQEELCCFDLRAP